MKKSLIFKEKITVMSMLFGLFFGAGNLIFPVYMGQLAGKNVWIAILGFLITGVSLPLLGVASIGKSKSDGMYGLSSKVSKWFGFFFTLVCTLTIGPFFAIPRCATTAFTVGISLLSGSSKSALFIFSLVFFLFAAFFSLRPGKILIWIGKILNPAFLLFLFILVIRAIFDKGTSFTDVSSSGTYETSAFFNGFYEGYNTLDAVAALVFGIVVVRVIKGLGVSDSNDVAKNTISSGIGSCIFMGVIYLSLAIVGAKSVNYIGVCSNGGEALAKISLYYFGSFGLLLLAIIVTLACLKTSVGLITSISEIFAGLFPKFISQKAWAIIFLVSSFAFANFGLDKIILYSTPFLMFIYPMTIALTVLGLMENKLKNRERVYKATLYVTLGFSFIELFRYLPFECDIKNIALDLAAKLPFGNIGLEWLIPAILTFIFSNFAAPKNINEFE